MGYKFNPFSGTFDDAGTRASGIAGSVQFSDGSGGLNSDATNLFWDNTSKIMTVSPGQNGTAMSVGNGTFISGFSGDGFLGAGATILNGAWTATQTSHANSYFQAAGNSGQYNIFTDSDLTPGVGFNPTLRFSIGKTGITDIYTGLLDMHSHKIQNVSDPTSPQDAATKNYVDTAILGVDLTSYFKKDGSVLATGDFDLDNHALKSVSVIDSVPGSDLDINAVPNTPFSSLLSTVSATVSGGLASPYSFATAVIGGKKYAYISTTSGNPIIQVFNLTDGTLVQEYHTSLGGSFFTGGNCVSNFANMLYLDDQNAHGQAAFNIDPSNGQILSQASPTLGWSGSEGGLACSSDGKILVFAGNNGTQSFTVDSSGNLTHVTTQAGTSFASTPVFSPSGTWILNGTTGLTGEIMSVHPTTGVLGAVTNVTTNLTKFAISPDGLHIYDASGHIFSLDEMTGVVTDLGITYPGSALNNQHCGTPVAVSPDGTTVITLDFTGVVASYSRNVITGALTLINSSLLSTGNSSSLNIAASVTVTNDRILVPTGFDDTTAHVSKLYLFATPAQGKVKLNSLQIADGSEGTAGHVWTSSDNLGNGSWAPVQTVLKTTLTLQGQVVNAIFTKTGSMVHLITDSFDVPSWSGFELGLAQLPVGYRPDASVATGSLVTTVDASGTVGTIGIVLPQSNGDLIFYKDPAGNNPIAATEYNFFGGINAIWTTESF